MRRKGERPVVHPPDIWSDRHPVARAIATGSGWLDAWLGQKTTPLHVIERRTKISGQRLRALLRDPRPDPDELAALAALWNIDPAELAKSLP